MGHIGGFWIRPESETKWDHAALDVGIEEPVVTEPDLEPDPVRKAICGHLDGFVGNPR
jgi:hypothetical protein